MRKSVPRPLTLRVPITNEEERALFQRRLGLTGFVVFALSGGFFLAAHLTLLLFSFSAGQVALMAMRPASRVHVATAVTSGLVWLALRRGKRSRELLGILDVMISIGLCSGWAVMATSGIALRDRPELVALLASSFTLVLRAALVPSTPARTAVLGALGLTPLVAITSSLYAGVPVHAPPAVGAAIWATLAVSATTVISHVTYGLRLQVREAMQLGQYLLEEKIGEGGMGVVYRASHAMLRRPTAIKLLSGTAHHAAARFEREVQITARLTHPNTVAVFDYGRTPDGVFYYAMEYLEGITLERLVEEYGPQPARRVAHVLLQICGALREAHAAGLVHRDIKPANVMLTQRGAIPDVVKVLDFGLVKESMGDPSATPADMGVSAVNTIMGTPHFMAPEAILDPSKIDGRADLYALGATAYFLLTGEHVFDGTNLVEICSQHVHEPPTPPSKRRADVPASVERAILACLAKKPDDRPADATALAKMVRGCELGEWTEDEAQAWWTNHPTSRRLHTADPAASESQISVLGDTIAIALDGRRVRESIQ